MGWGEGFEGFRRVRGWEENRRVCNSKYKMAWTQEFEIAAAVQAVELAVQERELEEKRQAEKVGRVRACVRVGKWCQVKEWGCRSCVGL